MHALHYISYMHAYILPLHTCTHTNTHTHTHTHKIHTCMHTQTHTYIHAYIHALHTSNHGHIHVYKHAPHTGCKTYTLTTIKAHYATCEHICIQKITCVTHTHTNIHPHIRRIHTYVMLIHYILAYLYICMHHNSLHYKHRYTPTYIHAL